MARTIDAAMAARLSDRVLVMVWFVELQFDTPTGTQRYHTDLGSITFSSLTFTGIGDLGEVAPIEESTEIAAIPLRCSLNAVNQTILDEAMTAKFQERPANVYIGVRNLTTGALDGTPQGPWRYFMSEMTVSPARIEMTLESEFILWNRAANKFQTDVHQQRRHPGDLFYEFVPLMKDRVLRVGPNRRPIVIGTPTEEEQLTIITAAGDRENLVESI